MLPSRSATQPADNAWASPFSKSLVVGGWARDHGLPLRRSIRTSRQAASWSWFLFITKLALSALQSLRAMRTAGDSSRPITARTPVEAKDLWVVRLDTAGQCRPRLQPATASDTSHVTSAWLRLPVQLAQEQPIVVAAQGRQCRAQGGRRGDRQAGGPECRAQGERGRRGGLLDGGARPLTRWTAMRLATRRRSSATFVQQVLRRHGKHLGRPTSEAKLDLATDHRLARSGHHRNRHRVAGVPGRRGSGATAIGRGYPVASAAAARGGVQFVQLPNVLLLG